MRLGFALSTASKIAFVQNEMVVSVDVSSLLQSAEDIVYRHLTPFLLHANLGPAIQEVAIGLICMPPAFVRESDSRGRLQVQDTKKIVKRGLDYSFSASMRYALPYEEVSQMTTPECVLLLFQKLKEFADALLKFRRKIDFDRQGFKDLILLAEHEYLQEVAVTPQSRRPEGA